jgi:hypothetical protein
MGLTPTSNIHRVTKLLELAREEQDKIAALLDEAQEILAGRPSIGQKMRVVTDAFSAAWAAAYQSPYAWDGKGSHVAALKITLKSLKPDEIAARVPPYLQDADPYYVNARHPFRLFLMNVNRYTPLHQAALDELDQEADETARLLRSRAR